MRLERALADLRCRRRGRGSRRPSSRGRAARRGLRRRRDTRRGPARGHSPRARATSPFSRAYYRCAIASISTSAPDGSFATSTVERAGGRSPTCARTRSSCPGSRRGSAGRRSSSRACRGPCRLRRGSLRGWRRPVRSAPRSCRRELLVAGLQRELARDEHEVACADRLRVRRALKRRGRGFGTDDGLVSHALLLCSQACAKRSAERLEDRLEHVLGVRPVQQPDVQRQPGALGEALEEAARDVGAETRRCGPRVRSTFETSSGVSDASSDDVRERLRRRHHRRAVARVPRGAAPRALGRARCPPRRPLPRPPPGSTSSVRSNRAYSARRSSRRSNTGRPVSIVAAPVPRISTRIPLRPAACSRAPIVGAGYRRPERDIMDSKDGPNGPPF